MSWRELQHGNPPLANFGAARFASSVAYLATLKKDGSPRVHPVTPILAKDRLFVFMEPTSPKGHDLRRDGRYAMHCSVGDSGGAGGEFLITGSAAFIEDKESREFAKKYASYDIIDRYILFELGVHTAFSNVYREGEEPERMRWKAS